MTCHRDGMNQGKAEESLSNGFWKWHINPVVTVCVCRNGVMYWLISVLQPTSSTLPTPQDTGIVPLACLLMGERAASGSRLKRALLLSPGLRYNLSPSTGKISPGEVINTWSEPCKVKGNRLMNVSSSYNHLFSQRRCKNCTESLYK